MEDARDLPARFVSEKVFIETAFFAVDWAGNPCSPASVYATDKFIHTDLLAVEKHQEMVSHLTHWAEQELMGDRMDDRITAALNRLEIHTSNVWRKAFMHHIADRHPTLPFFQEDGTPMPHASLEARIENHGVFSSFTAVLSELRSPVVNELMRIVPANSKAEAMLPRIVDWVRDHLPPSDMYSSIQECMTKADAIAIQEAEEYAREMFGDLWDQPEIYTCLQRFKDHTIQYNHAMVSDLYAGCQKHSLNTDQHEHVLEQASKEAKGAITSAARNSIACLQNPETAGVLLEHSREQFSPPSLAVYHIREAMEQSLRYFSPQEQTLLMEHCGPVLASTENRPEQGIAGFDRMAKHTADIGYLGCDNPDRDAGCITLGTYRQKLDLIIVSGREAFFEELTHRLVHMAEVQLGREEIARITEVVTEGIRCDKQHLGDLIDKTSTMTPRAGASSGLFLYDQTTAYAGVIEDEVLDLSAYSEEIKNGMYQKEDRLPAVIDETLTKTRVEQLMLTHFYVTERDMSLGQAQELAHATVRGMLPKLTAAWEEQLQPALDTVATVDEREALAAQTIEVTSMSYSRNEALSMRDAVRINTGNVDR